MSVYDGSLKNIMNLKKGEVRGGISREFHVSFVLEVVSEEFSLAGALAGVCLESGVLAQCRVLC